MEQSPRRPGQTGREDAYHTIRRQIIDLTLPPGATLSENELAAALHLSRTPVREALVLLKRERLVEVIPKVGTFVSRVDPAEVAEAQFLREAVEVASIESLVAPLNEAIMGQILANLDTQDGIGTDIVGFFDLDEAFHGLLMSLAGHAMSWASVAPAKGHLDRARMLSLNAIPSINTRIHEHHAIADAVASGQLDTATLVLRMHLRNVFGDITLIRQQHPELFVANSVQPDTAHAGLA